MVNERFPLALREWDVLVWVWDFLVPDFLVWDLDEGILSNMLKIIYLIYI
jgi:hypothetical protein